MGSVPQRLSGSVPGVLLGIAAGVGLGVAIAAAGVPFGVPLGALFGALLGAVIADRPRGCSTGVATRGQQGSAGRAMLWLLGGFALLVMAVVAIAPELLGASPAAAGQIAIVVLLAAVPGLVAVLALAARRRSADDPER